MISAIPKEKLCVCDVAMACRGLEGRQAHVGGRVTVRLLPARSVRRRATRACQPHAAHAPRAGGVTGGVVRQEGGGAPRVLHRPAPGAVDGRGERGCRAAGETGDAERRGAVDSAERSGAARVVCAPLVAVVVRDLHRDVHAHHGRDERPGQRRRSDASKLHSD